MKYTDEDGVVTTMDSGNYILGTEGRLAIVEIPDFTPRIIDPIEITYTAGYTSANLPGTIRRAMLLLIGYWYEHRGDYVATGVRAVSPEIDSTVRTLLNQNRTWFL